MSATTPSTTPGTTTSGPSIASEIDTAAGIAAGVASAVPGGQPVALGIGAAAAIADLVVHISSLYSQKVITAQQLAQMVNVAVSGFDASVAAWDAASPKTTA